jgi:two-component system cell cycle sensor histidine kinase/response regulator CckA
MSSPPRISTRPPSESAAELRLTLDAAGVGVWEWNVRTRAIRLNVACYAMLGYEPDEVAWDAEQWLAMVHPEDVAEVRGKARALLKGLDTTVEVESRVRSKSGEWCWILWRSRPVERDAAGRLWRLAGTQLDITRRKQAEEALRRSEERYRELIENQGEGIGIVDGEERFLFVNPAGAQIFGVPPGSMIGRSLGEFMEPEEFGSVQAQTERRRDGQRDSYELGFVRADGARRIMLVTATPQYDAEGQFVGSFGIFRDITERTAAEAALRESEERYRQLIESLPHGVGLLVRGRVVFANATTVRMLGFDSFAQLDGLKGVDLLAEADREQVLGLLGELLAGESTGPVSYLTRVKRRHGADFPVEAYVTRVTFRGAPALQLFMLDLSERVEAEQERARLEAHLREALKMESIGRLAGGIAHDFNNLLQPIIMHAEVALLELAAGDRNHQDFVRIREAALRAKELVQQLLAFGRRQTLSVQPLDVNQVIRESHDMLRRFVREDIEMRVDLEPSIGLVKGDPSQLQQVLMNLTLNARDSMPHGGTLSVATASTRLEPELSGGSEPAGPHVLLTVRDTGAGMDPDTLSRIFEPFFSTKGVGQGTGLGLSTVHGIVRQHGGHITVDSEPSRGTEFRIYFPVVSSTAPDAVADSREAPASPAVSYRFDRTVLVAEDEALARGLLCHTLRRHGFTVIEARDGDEALAKAAEHQGRIHLLLTDVVMPRLSGKELHDRLCQAQPPMPVIFMSGYTDEIVARHGVLTDGMLFLQKPFFLSSLLQRIRQALSR